MFNWRELMWKGRATIIVKTNKKKQYPFKIIKDPKKDNIFYVHKNGYIGHIEKRGRYALLVLQSPKFMEGLEYIQAIDIVIECASSGRDLPEGWSVEHAGKCVMCDRELTDEVSKDLGIGPICRSK